MSSGYGYDSLEAIRVYYGDTEGYIQELGTSMDPLHAN